MLQQTVSTTDILGKSLSTEHMRSIFFYFSYSNSLHDKDDSTNGSKTQSSATTESNTPENTIRLENMGQKVNHSFTIENNEVVLESNLCCLIAMLEDFINIFSFHRRHQRK